MSILGRQPNSQTGLTLIEMLIALMLGAFLLGSVIQTFLAARQSYRTQEGLSRLIENGRYAMEFISHDIRMAGFRGCNSGLQIVNHLSGGVNAYLTNYDTAIQGFEYDEATAAWLPTQDGSISLPNDGSDIITIRKADETGHSVIAHDKATHTVTLDNVAGLEAGKYDVLIADCSQAGAFPFPVGAISGLNVDYGNYAPAVTVDFNNAELSPIHTISYYIRDNVNGIPSLYQRIDDDNPRELVESIEGLQIEYGEDTDMDPLTGSSPDYAANFYTTANLVNLRRVVSIRVRLLVATPSDNVTMEKAGWTFNGQTTAANLAPDHRIRHEFVSTIALRNRIN